MNINTKIVASLVCLSMLPLANAADFEDTARVLSATPQVEQFNQPRQECRAEIVNVQQPAQQRGYGGAIIGGLAGGLLGNQVGKGNGRTVATAGGAVVGALVGDNLSNGNNTGAPAYTQQQVQNCRMVDSWQTRTNGYAVTYSYRGKTHAVVLPYQPGNTIRVRVSVAPII
jgi:uncharacterized protein YcfJ